VLIENRYSTLSNFQESQSTPEVISSPNDKYPFRSTITQKYKYSTRLSKRRQSTQDHHGLNRVSTKNKHNLQEQKGNGNDRDDRNYIPTIINGMTNINHISESNVVNKISVNNQLSELRNIININNRKIGSLPTKQKIVQIFDSNIRGYVHNMKSLLQENYELYSVIKPGATMNELQETARKEISKLTCNDVIVISYGINDYEANNFSTTLKNITDFIQRNNQTNIILMNLSYRYDLPNSTDVNEIITTINRKVKKIVKAFPYTHFMEMDNDRILFTNHRLHKNKLGKWLVNCQIVNFLYSIFEPRDYPPMSLGWYEPQNYNDLTQEENQSTSVTRNSSRTKRMPVTRSDDFLWQV